MSDTIRWLTVQDAAERACCDQREVRRAVRRGILRAVRSDGDLRFLERWIDEWLIDQLLPEDYVDGEPLDAAALRRALASW